MRTTDNNCGKTIADCQYDEQKHCIDDLRVIANKNLDELQKNNPDLLVFPQSFGKYNDDVEKSIIFSLITKPAAKSDEEKLTTNNILTTNNMMGFVGRNNTQLTICSRFAKDDNDYFLHYMLQKVFAINIFNFDQTNSNENIWDFLLYLFPYYLKRAYAQGLYKAYRREHYNDANVKGTIDVSRNIRINIPFAGKIAYNTREHSYDNPVTQLIRHTIEHIKMHPWGSGILTSDSDTRDIVSKICFVTQNRYNKNERQKVINANLKPVTHPYFTEYKTLQKICSRILRHEKLTFGKQQDKIYGLLFDGAWLWEEYLNKVFIENHLEFTHAENKTRKNPIYLFVDNKYDRYPDFYKDGFVLDAKYKNLSTSVDRDDIHQIISYMYVQKAVLGGFINPEKEQIAINQIPIGELNGYGGKVKIWKLHIPQTATSFSCFQTEIQESEKAIIGELQ